MATETAHRTRQDLLGVYLNDHLAGSTVGMSLARRMVASAEPGSERATVLSRLATEITEDRSALLRIMAALDIQVRGYKVFAAWAGEKVGRLKLNGYLLTRSPLSDLEETEFLWLSVEGKAAGWRTLREIADRDSRLDAGRLDDLIARANHQASVLESLRSSTAERVLTSDAR
jgi:nucleotide-binding universal stress UspA family protein